jgi:hypothetical protein
MRSPVRRQSVNVILTQSMTVHSLKSEQKLDERGHWRPARALRPGDRGARISSIDNEAPSAWSEVGHIAPVSLQCELRRLSGAKRTYHEHGATWLISDSR